MKNKPHILLTGASGTVGRQILKQLYQQSDKFMITVFELKTKKSLKILSPYKKDVEIIFGDISNFEEVRKVCRDIDFAIHLAAIIPPLADEKPELAFKVNTVGTENLVRNLEQLSPEVFLLYSSSISVYGDRLESPYIKITDQPDPNEGDEYAKTKIKAEEVILGSKLDWSIFRLTAIMGSHKISKLMFHMPLSTPMEIATPSDTANAFIHALGNKALISKKIFNLGGGENCRIIYREFLSRSFEIFGLGKLNFPEKSFAEKNFHCGFYEDGDELENFLHFRNDTIDSYFLMVKQTTPFWRIMMTFAFRNQIKNYLLKQSDPYKAFITGDAIMSRHYFKNY